MNIEEIINKHNETIVYVCRNYANNHHSLELDDFVQECKLRICIKLKDVPPSSPERLREWIWSTCRNCCLNLIRVNNRQMPWSSVNTNCEEFDLE